MTVADWSVVVGGAAAIAWFNWYFFVSGRAGPRGPAERGNGGVR